MLNETKKYKCTYYRVQRHVTDTALILSPIELDELNIAIILCT